MTLFAHKNVARAILACALFVSFALPQQHAAVAESNGPSGPSSDFKTFIPVLNNQYWPASPFGIETAGIAEPVIQSRTRELGTRWIRLNGVSWMSVQPNQGDPYNWAALANFENQLLNSVKMGLTPIVTINRSPRWATVIPDACGAVREDRFGDFANFMEALVTRYSKAPFNVKYWEMFNEVDVEYQEVPLVDHVIGCWGDRNDPFYGGRHYGNMLKAVTPAIKRADSEAKVLAGAFILIRPNTQWQYVGKPENFLPGVPEAGAAPYFDILSFHSHGWYWFSPFEDNGPGNDWTPYGSTVDAKARFFKKILDRYGVSKPLFMDESAFICPDVPTQAEACKNPPPEFFDSQANYVIRGYSASLEAGVSMIAWYTIEEQGWGSSGLMDTSLNPRPVFKAYQTLMRQLAGAALPPTAVNYGAGVQGWRFRVGNHFVDVVYASFIGAKNISWPAASHIAMYDRFGQSINPGFSGGNATYTVSLEPVFIHRAP